MQGKITVSGAKNAALPILASTLLGSEECEVSNLPQVRDVTTMLTLLGMLGATVKSEAERAIIRAEKLTCFEAPYDLVKTMRASILVLGPLIARYGQAVVSLPGGCAIGDRPVSLHLQGLETLGAEVEVDHGYIRAQASRLRGGHIDLEVPTVTGTENLIMAACLAKGTTVIRNAAKEPEIVDLVSFLLKRGARIHGEGTDVITIEGVERLQRACHAIVSDRIEAGTYLMAGAITRGDVCVERCVPSHLSTVLRTLEECGAEIIESDQAVRLKASRPLRAIAIKTSPYPGFPTDLQAQMMALLCTAQGNSSITETVFESRFIHVSELVRMGACIDTNGRCANIKGPARMAGAPVMASDLRASASLVLAGLAAEGKTEVSRIYHLDRGYERLEDKLQSLGALVHRTPASV